jgi:hypothetical protein
LKKWTEDVFDVEGTVDVANFTLEVCKEKWLGVQSPPQAQWISQYQRINYEISMVIETCGRKGNEN